MRAFSTIRRTSREAASMEGSSGNDDNCSANSDIFFSAPPSRFAVATTSSTVTGAAPTVLAISAMSTDIGEAEPTHRVDEGPGVVDFLLSGRRGGRKGHPGRQIQAAEIRREVDVSGAGDRIQQGCHIGEPLGALEVFVARLAALVVAGEKFAVGRGILVFGFRRRHRGLPDRGDVRKLADPLFHLLQLDEGGGCPQV